MVLKRRTQNPQEYIQAGMAFFLIGIFASMLADGRLLGVFITDMLSGRALQVFQGFADGLSIPFSMASIYFNLRGLILLRRDQSKT